jgi:hypothetical protein
VFVQGLQASGWRPTMIAFGVLQLVLVLLLVLPAALRPRAQAGEMLPGATVLGMRAARARGYGTRCRRQRHARSGKQADANRSRARGNGRTGTPTYPADPVLPSPPRRKTRPASPLPSGGPFRPVRHCRANFDAPAMPRTIVALSEVGAFGD